MRQRPYSEPLHRSKNRAQRSNGKSSLRTETRQRTQKRQGGLQQGGRKDFGSGDAIAFAYRLIPFIGSAASRRDEKPCKRAE